MDLAKIGRTYVERLIDNDGKPKILLLDAETTGILSLVTTQSFLLKNDVFLVDSLDNSARQKMRHLNCVVFVRPTAATLALLVEELRQPRYGSYALTFTNFVLKSQLERLAEADDHEAVVKVQEMFCDWFKVNADFWNVGLSPDFSWLKSPNTGGEWLDRSSDAMVAMLLSLKFRKPQFRVESNSTFSRKLATEVASQIDRHTQLIDQFPYPEVAPLVLIVDRLNDPVTALLSHWTYQAMVDELIGISRTNRVDLSGAADVPADQRDIVLSQTEDSFFATAMFLNFGDLGAAVRDYVSQYQSQSRTTGKIDTVADMKRFVEEYPEFRRLGGNVAKHVALVGELSRLVDAQHLLAVSELEQSLACSEHHSQDLNQLQEILAAPQIPEVAKCRLVALYALRYRRHPQCATQALVGLLAAHQGETAAARFRQALDTLLEQSQPQEDLFNQGSLLLRAQQGLKGLKGVDNVFTQHKPLLESTLQAIARGKLPKDKYPVIHGPQVDAVPQDVLVFVVGGATFEEARVTSEVASATPGIRIVLGGTSVTNPTRFLSDLSQ